MFSKLARRVVSLLLLLVMAVMLAPKPALAAEDDGGYCGTTAESWLSQEGQADYVMHGPAGAPGGFPWHSFSVSGIRSHDYYQDGGINSHWWYFFPYHWPC